MDTAAFNRARALLAAHNNGRPIIDGDKGSTFVSIDTACKAIGALLDHLDTLPGGWRFRADTGPTLHQFTPDSKYPWFCKECGYGPGEALKHFQAEAT